MNFGAFPLPVCAPLKPRHNPIDYPGTANVVCGHRMREPYSNCRYMRQFYDLRKATTLNPGEAEEARALHRFIFGMDFEEHTDKRVIGGKIHRRVEQGMTAYEEDIDIRREKLRCMILVEEAALTKEVVFQAQHGEDSRMDDMRARTEELRKRREEEHTATVAAKRMQQYLARCPDARDTVTKRNTMDAKHCNLVQMAENEAKREAERELDMLWHELMLKEVEMKKYREVEEEKRRVSVFKEIVETLDKQVAGKRALEAEKRKVQQDQQEFLERLWENIRKEEISNLERENRRRARLKKELEDQIIIAKRCLAERAREENAMDQMFKALGDAELAKEKAAIANTAGAMRRELFAYIKNLEDLREEEARRNREVEEIVEQSRKNEEARRRLALDKFKAARARSLQEVISGRDQQMKEKREAAERAKERERDEKLIMDKELELEANLIAYDENNKRERARRYGRELKAQQNYIDARRQREKDENDRMYQQGLKREEEYQRLTEVLIQASNTITPHAFKILLKECAARHAAEQKGLCYCPPPPPPAPC